MIFALNGSMSSTEFLMLLTLVGDGKVVPVWTAVREVQTPKEVFETLL